MGISLTLKQWFGGNELSTIHYMLYIIPVLVIGVIVITYLARMFSKNAQETRTKGLDRCNDEIVKNNYIPNTTPGSISALQVERLFIIMNARRIDEGTFIAACRGKFLYHRIRPTMKHLGTITFTDYYKDITCLEDLSEAEADKLIEAYDLPQLKEKE